MAMQNDPPAQDAMRRRRPITRLLRGRPDDPAWVRPALLALLALTAVAYLWGLGDSGWANAFYSAAVQAGSKSWEAFFFGSFDAANFITVDKPPAALWVMGLSVRLFGLNAWSILVPQALEGVASVAILYATVRRWFQPGAALLAGTILALTPVAALMFRFNNPDALLVMLLTASAYALVRALERSETKWLLLAAALLGTGFLTKMLAAFLVVPGFVLVYLVAAKGTLGRRIDQLIMAGVALAISSGWWIAAVQLIPAADRPYIGGSQDNSLLNLIFGYNGFGRITGNEAGSVGGGGAPGAVWGATGLGRLFQSQMGGQISWLVPAALLLLVVVLVLTHRAQRTDQTRAQMLLWGSWLVVTGLVFSLGQGIIHPYYTVALAPAVAALVAIGADFLWARRKEAWPRLWLAVAVLATAVWASVLLSRTPTWLPWLRLVVVALGVAAAVVVGLKARSGSRALVLGPVLAIVAALAGPAAYTFATVSTQHSGAIPSAGPAFAGSFGGFGGFGSRGTGGERGFGRRGGFPGRTGGGGRFQGGTRGPSGTTPSPQGGGWPGSAAGRPSGPRAEFGNALGEFGRGGGLLNSRQPSPQFTALLEKGAGQYTWVAATVGANSAAGYQLATEDPVMAIGGFNGTDPAPSLAQFQQDVRQGRIHYFIASGGFGSFGGRSQGTAAAQITQWVESTFHAINVGGQTVYDLTSAK